MTQPQTAPPPSPNKPPPVRANPHLSSGRMKLTNLVSGTLTRPPRILIYGVDGIGKSTFAASADAPVFIGFEDGSLTLDIHRFPEPQSWLDAIEAVDELTLNDSPFRTVVIDSLDWLEPLCWSYVCATTKDKRGQPYTRIDAIPFGNGVTAALDLWRVLLSKLDHLRVARGMAVVLVAHGWIKRFANPEGEDFDRYELKLNPKAAGVIREWCDCVLFATHEQYTHDLGGRPKGISTGARIVHTERGAAFDAKNRYALPPTLPLDWQSLRDAMAAGQPADPETLKNRIAALLSPLDTEHPLRDRVAMAIVAAGDSASELSRILNKLQAQVSIDRQQQTHGVEQ